MIAAFRLAVVLALVAGTANAREVGVEILQYGLFRSDIVGKQRDPSGISHNVVDNICHIATTRAVPLRIGLHFGVRYKVTGPRAGEPVLLAKVVRFPAAMAVPGAPPQSKVTNFVQLPVGATSYAEYALEQPWELVAGTWTFQFFESNRLLAEFSFTVAEDASVTETEPTCFQLSS